MNKISIKVIDSPRVDYEGLRFLSQEIFRIEKRSILNFFKPAEFYANVKNFLKAFFFNFQSPDDTNAFNMSQNCLSVCGSTGVVSSGWVFEKVMNFTCFWN